MLRNASARTTEHRRAAASHVNLANLLSLATRVSITRQNDVNVLATAQRSMSDRIAERYLEPSKKKEEADDGDRTRDPQLGKSTPRRTATAIPHSQAKTLPIGAHACPPLPGLCGPRVARGSVGSPP
jgi:hypothetical protein